MTYNRLVQPLKKLIIFIKSIFCCFLLSLSQTLHISSLTLLFGMPVLQTNPKQGLHFLLVGEERLQIYSLHGKMVAEHMWQHMALFKHPSKSKADPSSNIPDEGAGRGTHMELCWIWEGRDQSTAPHSRIEWWICLIWAERSNYSKLFDVSLRWTSQRWWNRFLSSRRGTMDTPECTSPDGINNY